MRAVRLGVRLLGELSSLGVNHGAATALVQAGGAQGGGTIEMHDGPRVFETGIASVGLK